MDGREWFQLASDGFRALVDQVPPEALPGPGLGEWDLRGLIGHTSRAYSTIENYLGAGPDPRSPLADAVEYFQAFAANRVDEEPLIRRGRDAGEALGEDVTRAVNELAERVLRLLADTPDDAQVTTAMGPMRLGDYLPTRAFELTVHGLDVARATRLAVPHELRAASVPAIELCAAIAEDDRRDNVLLALTGREPLRPGFTVL